MSMSFNYNARFLGMKCTLSWIPRHGELYATDEPVVYIFAGLHQYNVYVDARQDGTYALRTLGHDGTIYTKEQQDDLKKEIKRILKLPYFETCMCTMPLRANVECSRCKHTHTTESRCGCMTNEYRNNKLYAFYNHETQKWERYEKLTVHEERRRDMIKYGYIKEE